MAGLGAAAPADAIAAPVAQVHVYAYDSIVPPAPSTDAASERGLPAMDAPCAVYDADGLRPLVAFARLDRGSIGRTSGYDGAQCLGGIARGSQVVERLSGNGRAKPAAVTRWRVAAKTAGELPELSVGRAQLEAKFKHAADSGVTESRGAGGFDAYGKAVDSFLGESSTVRVAGTYRGNAAILNYNPVSRLVVVQSPEGAFVSGWQMSEAQLENVISRGSLGGG